VGFDEYSHWLPNLGYLVLHDHLPSLAEPGYVSVRPGYPPGDAFVGLAVSRIVGHVAESAGIVWSVLLYLALGVLCGDLIERQLGSDVAAKPGAAKPGAAKPGGAASWGAAAIGLSAVTLLSPSFQPHLVLSNYGDAPTGSVTAIMAVAFMAWLDDTRQRGSGSWRQLWSLGLCGAALVSIRQDSLITWALFCTGALAAMLAERHQGTRHPLLLLLALLPAPLAATVVWRVYQATEIPAGAATMLPVAQWHWPQLPDMLAAMLQVMLRHWAHFGLIVALAAVAVTALAMPKCFTPLQRTAAALGATIGLGEIASLVLLYLGADFSPAQAATATEFWRFNLHAGPSVTGAAMMLLPWRRVRRSEWGWLSVSAACFAVLLLVSQVGSLRVDFRHGIPNEALYLRSVGREVAALSGGASPITLVDTTDIDYMNIPHVVYVRYELLLGLRPTLATPVPAVRLVEGDPPREVVLNGGMLSFAVREAPTSDAMTPDAMAPDAMARDAMASPFIWFYDGGAVAGRLVGLDLPRGASYLVSRDAKGVRIVKSWPLPGQTNGSS
jgi:hypothetical protein